MRVDPEQTKLIPLKGLISLDLAFHIISNFWRYLFSKNFQYFFAITIFLDQFEVFRLVLQILISFLISARNFAEIHVQNLAESLWNSRQVYLQNFIYAKIDPFNVSGRNIEEKERRLK